MWPGCRLNSWSCDQSRRKNNAFTLSATLPTWYVASNKQQMQWTRIWRNPQEHWITGNYKAAADSSMHWLSNHYNEKCTNRPTVSIWHCLVTCDRSRENKHALKQQSMLLQILFQKSPDFQKHSLTTSGKKLHWKILQYLCHFRLSGLNQKLKSISEAFWKWFSITCCFLRISHLETAKYFRFFQLAFDFF